MTATTFPALLDDTVLSTEQVESVIIYLYTNHPLKFCGKDYLKYIQGDFSLKWMKRSQVTYLLIVLIMKQESSGLVRLCKSRFG